MEYAHFLYQHIEDVLPGSNIKHDALLKYFSPKQIAKKQRLICIQQQVQAEYLVMKGCLKTVAYDEYGKEYILQFAQEHWWVSDYPAYTQQSLAEMDVIAAEDSLVLELSIENRRRMCKELPIMHTFFEHKAFGGYVASQKRVLSLLRNSAQEKYDLLLHQYPELFQRLPHKVIAQYLGVSRETLSRLGKKNLSANR